MIDLVVVAVEVAVCVSGEMRYAEDKKYIKKHTYIQTYIHSNMQTYMDT